MQETRFHFSGKLALLLVAAVPLAAQTTDASTDILKGFSYPPLHRVSVANLSPDAAVSVAKMRVAYGFSQIRAFGGGQTIAIIDAYDDPNIEADLGTFTTAYHLPACTTVNGCFTKLYQTGTVPPKDTSGWSNEIAIDVEWSHAIAPTAKIILVEANSNSNADLYAAVDVAVQAGANVVSMSFGGGESSNESTTDAHFNVPGVTFVASSGDSGNGAQYPAASPYVVGVGGTSLTVNSSTGAWMSETAWSDSGGGVSTYEAEPSYQSGVQSTGRRGIPDVAYDGDPNTGVLAYSSYACRFCYTGWQQWGGTSIGAPQWAALFAITNSLRQAYGKTTLSQVQLLLYPDAETDYHDITSGTNGGCGALCTAMTGYDFVTGLGSPQANLLIPALVKAP